MTFGLELKGMIGQFDEQNTLWRTLLQSIHDHGGGVRHLNNLLADAKCQCLLVNELAKLIVGNIWKLQAEPIDLDLTEDDFRVSGPKFLLKYPSIKLPYSNDFSESKSHPYGPTRPCKYKLYHPVGPMLFREIVEEFEPLTSRYEHAGWRELVAYVSRLQSADICGCNIIAAGSLVVPVEGGERGQDHAFPMAHSYSPNNISVDWKGVERETVEKFGVECFYLVRVYD